MRNAYKILVGKAEGKRSLEIPRCNVKNDIKMDLKETGRKIVDWILVVQDTIYWRTPLDRVMELLIP
jgi:hypothetical protein